MCLNNHEWQSQLISAHSCVIVNEHIKLCAVCCRPTAAPPFACPAERWPARATTLHSVWVRPNWLKSQDIPAKVLYERYLNLMTWTCLNHVLQVLKNINYTRLYLRNEYVPNLKHFCKDFQLLYYKFGNKDFDMSVCLYVCMSVCHNVVSTLLDNQWTDFQNLNANSSSLMQNRAHHF